MDDRRLDLAKYRLSQADDSLNAALICKKQNIFKDAVDRSYYAAFYAMKPILALDGADFRRHKDVVAYFNRNYVVTDIFPKVLGRKISKLQQMRERGDYDDFFLISKEDATNQIDTAKAVIIAVRDYLKNLS